MKTFKQLILLFTISIFIFSCDSNDKGVGMNTWEGVEDLKFHLGTEETIKTVMEFDKADREKDYEKMRSMMTDTTTFTGPNGIKRNVDEFFDRRNEMDSIWESDGATYTWESTAMFSVDLAPGEGGELVHNYFDGTFTQGDEVNNFRGMGIWYIVDGKVVQVNTYWQNIQDEEDNDSDEKDEE
tara:strand:+ start:1248 stop:1796 length:549 start_codon:yes stop_codon:yes gene_type:complete